MSKLEQVMQIGEVGGSIGIYIEDYAYTYLKKQKGNEKTKYFLYGEKEETEQQKKLYIYGIAEKPKMEQTYFKEYYPLGFLKYKDNEKYLITLNGQEEKIKGFYVFYASNRAMQEYLVDHHEETKVDKPENKTKRQMTEESLPIKEMVVPSGKYRAKKRRKVSQNDNFIYSFCGIAVAIVLAFVLTSTNGQKKIEIFKKVIAETMASTTTKMQTNDMIIEEKSISQTEEVQEEKDESSSVNANEIKVETVKEESQEKTEIDPEKIISEQEEASSQEEISSPKEETVLQEEALPIQEEKIYEEYIVKKGDTLAAICKRKYGTLSNMREICNINNIENADYIEPGQKIYLLK